jgi:hypothetical protein
MDGNKRHNHWKNLQWCTASENQKHAYDVLNVRNGKTGYNYAKLYPNEELRSRLKELGVPRWKHNLAELGEMLPAIVTKRSGEDHFLTSCKTEKDGWKVWYETDLGVFQNEDVEPQGGDTEADARAKMLVYLLENGLMK